jgi:hypothetical protein
MGWPGRGCRGQMRSESRDGQRLSSYVESLSTVQLAWDTTGQPKASKSHASIVMDFPKHCLLG